MYLFLFIIMVYAIYVINTAIRIRLRNPDFHLDPLNESPDVTLRAVQFKADIKDR
jgi:hypothetical protein